MRAGAEMALTVYDHPFTMISSFKYLGRVLSVSDDNCPEVVSNTWKEWNKCARLSRVLGWEVTDARSLWNFYLEVVQLVLLFG